MSSSSSNGMKGNQGNTNNVNDNVDDKKTEEEEQHEQEEEEQEQSDVGGTGARGSSYHWVGETFPEIGYSQYLRVDQSSSKPLYSTKSKYQDIAIYTSTPHFGKVLVLDNVVQLTERDASSYNEMMSHVPMMEHDCPEFVLIIGGGDGYVLSEVLKHESVKHVDIVELDSVVVETCKEHFKWSQKAFNDPRITLHIDDGSKFVENSKSRCYDVIIQDSSDPFAYDEQTGNIVDLPSGVLFQSEHFIQVERVLKYGGIFSFQAETFGLPADLNGVVSWRTQIMNINNFTSCRYGTIHTTSYPLGQIGFLLCQKQQEQKQEEEEEKDEEEKNKMEQVQRRFERMEELCSTNNRGPECAKDEKGDDNNNNDEDDGRCKYYWPQLQTSCFHLPRWVHDKIYNLKQE